MLQVLYEDELLLVVEKPPGLESQSIHSFEPDMVSEIRKHLQRNCRQKGEPYVGVIHRLDKPVGGILVYAKTPETAAFLSSQVSNGQMKKLYLAVVCGKPVDKLGEFVDYVWKVEENSGKGKKQTGARDGSRNLSQILDENDQRGKLAKLRYQVLEHIETEDGGLTLVEIELMTGRHHQIRVQFAGHGLPIWGDFKYNPVCSAAAGRGGHKQIALSACKLTFTHPSTGKRMSFSAPPQGAIFKHFSTKEVN